MVFQSAQYRGDCVGCFLSLAAILDGAVGVSTRRFETVDM
jgi:hypothetical protein